MLLSSRPMKGATAAVLRSCRGEALVAMTWLMDHLLDASTAEARAIQKGLEFVEYLGCTRLIVESDSLEVIQACNGLTEIWSLYTAALADCFPKARTIGAVTFVHCPREANTLAHKLARYTSCDTNSVVTWDDDPPSLFLFDIVRRITLLE